MAGSLTSATFALLMRRIQRAAAPPTSAASLKRYLDAAAPLLRPGGRRSLEPPALTGEAFEALMVRTRSTLEQARTAGAHINVWTVAGLKRDEVRNAAVLAWFLDPSASHGLGSAMLDRFLHRAALHAGWRPLAIDAAKARAHTEFRPRGSETDRVDVVVDDGRSILFVEVKIDAAEGVQQLSRYAAAAGARGRDGRLLFLSPTAAASLPPGAVWMTWRDVEVAARSVAGAGAGLGRTLLAQFADHVRRF